MAFRNIIKLAIFTLAVCFDAKYICRESACCWRWTIPIGGPIAYDAWASLQDFNVGDIVLFNFTNGEQDIARVTKEAYMRCNKTKPISLEMTSPANFTFDDAGYYYFISTLAQHCFRGQKLAIHVHGPSHSPNPVPREPLNYTVGDILGWIVPPGGDIAYATWAHWKTFTIGDSLVFHFIEGTQDVAVVTKEAYEKCETNHTLATCKSSPTKIILSTTGEHFFTSTYSNHCALGQKLAINVTANSSTGFTLSPEGALSPNSFGPSASALAPISSAPSTVVRGYMLTLLFLGLAFIN